MPKIVTFQLKIEDEEITIVPPDNEADYEYLRTWMVAITVATVNEMLGKYPGNMKMKAVRADLATMVDAPDLPGRFLS